MADLISIIVPCYNQGHFLSETLESVKAQSHTNWECVIVNDGSADNTEEIAARYTAEDTRFKYLAQVNGGLSNARNAGIKFSTGDYIQLLDSDDLIEKDKLKTAVDLYSSGGIDKNTIIYSSMRYFEDEHPATLYLLGRDDFIAHIEAKQEDDAASQQALLKARNPFVISAPLYPKSVFNSAGYFDENLKALEDWDFHIRCINRGYKFHHHYNTASRTLIRLHNSSMMRNQKLLDDNFFQLIQKHHLRPVPVIKKEPVIKKILREITPPILTKIVKTVLRTNA